ncbi:MAG: DoxX family protein [Chitinophagaceae bacterium]|nr:MAG: DoxX family protein [Chitinophagaceae bacterium]
MRKLFSVRTSDNALSLGTLLLRLTGGVLMIHHGFDKLTHFSQKAHQFMDPFGIGSTTSLSLVVFAEFFCAAFLILGLFTRLAAIPLIVTMCVALFKAHGADFAGQGELAAVYLGLYLSILVLGPGKVSLDRFLGK